MLTIRAMSDGTGYSARHLQHSDYYADGERVTGQWQGRGAEMLGLAGEVQSEEFEALRQGLDPQSGEFLRQSGATARPQLPTRTSSPPIRWGTRPCKRRPDSDESSEETRSADISVGTRYGPPPASWPSLTEPIRLGGR